MHIKNEIAVGVLFTTALIILGYFTIMVKDEIFQPRDYYVMHVKFDNVEGLESGDDVKVNGVKAGVVDKIALEAESIDVQLKMFSSFRMFENYRIKIASQSALGGKYISIYPGARMLHGTIHKEISDRSELTGISGDDPIALISDLVSENREGIYQTIKNIEMITGKLNSGSGTLGKLLTDTKVHDNANDLVKELRDTVEDAREQAPITSFIRAALTVF
ncbi:MAG: MCE family protein [Spirochaetes bacterium]|nr:MAG: MCE family protein [Spirochaetota bacterium]